MQFCKYEIPLLLRDGFEFYSLDFIREVHGEVATKPRAWVLKYTDLIAQIKRANYAHVDGDIIEFVEFENGDVHTYAMLDAATAYAFFLGEETGCAFAGAVSSLTKLLEADKRELPRYRVDRCNVSEEDRAVMAVVTQDLEDLEREIQQALSHDYGIKSIPDYPPRDVIVRLTGVDEANIVGALQRINPNVEVGADPRESLKLVSSHRMKLLDHKFRLICAHNIFDILLDLEAERTQEQVSAGWVEEVVHEVIDDGLDAAGGFLEEGLNAAENFILAAANGAKHQFQVVYDGLYVRAQVVVL